MIRSGGSHIIHSRRAYGRTPLRHALSERRTRGWTPRYTGAISCVGRTRRFTSTPVGRTHRSAPTPVRRTRRSASQADTQVRPYASQADTQFRPYASCAGGSADQGTLVGRCGGGRGERRPLRRALGQGAGRPRAGDGESDALRLGRELPVHRRRLPLRAQRDEGPATPCLGPAARGAHEAGRRAVFCPGLPSAASRGDAGRDLSRPHGDADQQIATDHRVDGLGRGRMGPTRPALLRTGRLDDTQ